MKTERLTKHTQNGYTTDHMEAALLRLGHLEDLYESLLEEKEKLTVEMEKLSHAGKTKSATYRQLFANKVNVTNMISRMDIWF